MLVAFAIAACVIAAGNVGRAQRGGGGPAGPQVTQSVPELRFRYVGPQSAGRVASVAGVPGDPTTYYLGAAAGGVWKSTDSGQSWEPDLRQMPVQAIGSLAVAPSDPNQVWAGTGEAWVIRDSDIGGDGIYKSTDAGKTWKNVGLPDAGRIGRIIVHPTNPNIVYACVIGRVTAPQPERGVYRTLDGGATWEKSLFVDPNTGCSGISMDRIIRACCLPACGRSSCTRGRCSAAARAAACTHARRRQYMDESDDRHAALAGRQDRRRDRGVESAADVRADSDRESRSLWRSEDGGATWKTVSWDRTLIGRAGYYICMKSTRRIG